LVNKSRRVFPVIDAGIDAVVDATSEGMTIDLRQVTYDEDELLDLVRRSAMPEANWWLGMRGA